MDDIVQSLSLERYLEVALKGKPNAKHLTSRESGTREDWFGTPNWDACVKLALGGWPEGRSKIGQILGEIETHESAITRPMPVWDVTGDFVDVGAYMSGQPECMVRWEEVPEVLRVARIAANVTASGGVSSEMIQWQGAITLALVDRLEASGIRAEVDMICAIKGNTGQKWITMVNLKRAEDSLALDTLAFHLVHPSSLRRLWFSYAECASPEQISEFSVGSCYGTPTHDLAADLAEIGQEYDLVMPSLHLNDVEKAVAAVEKLFSQVCDVQKYYS